MNTFYILMIALLLVVYQVQAIEEQQSAVVCNTFRITSPAVNNLHWTAGQCYQVSYDLGEAEGNNNQISVDLVNSVTKQSISLVQAEPVNPEGATNAFNLNATESGTYHYSVTFIHDGVKCEPKRTVDFKVTVNPYSPPSRC